MSKKALQQKKAAFLTALEKSFGNVTLAANVIGVHRTLPYKWAEKDIEFKEKMDSTEYGERFKDMIEGNLASLAIEKDKTVLIFLAKTKCKDRGYIEKSELTVNDGVSKIIFEDAEKDKE